MSEYLGVTRERRQKSPIARDIVAELGIGFARQRAKPWLTPMPIRLRIIREARGRERSLRRRLTRLDRALTDEQARTLNRAYDAWLICEGKASTVQIGKIGFSAIDREPLTQRELAEIGAYRIAVMALAKRDQDKLSSLFNIIAPWNQNELKKPSVSVINEIVDLAKKLQKSY